MLRILSLIIAIVLSGTAIVFLFGYNAPEEYQDSISFKVSYATDTTWEQLINIKEIATRKSDVSSIEILEEFGKLVAWRENLKTGGYRIYRTNQRIEGQKLVVELTESSYGLTGIWTFYLSKDKVGNDTVVVIEETSKFTNTLKRGYRVIVGREHDLLVWQKYIKVGLVQTLLITP